MKLPGPITTGGRTPCVLLGLGYAALLVYQLVLPPGVASGEFSALAPTFGAAAATGRQGGVATTATAPPPLPPRLRDPFTPLPAATPAPHAQHATPRPRELTLEPLHRAVLPQVRLIRLTGGRPPTAVFRYGDRELARRPGEHVGTYRVVRVVRGTVQLVNHRRQWVRLAAGEELRATATRRHSAERRRYSGYGRRGRAGYRYRSTR
jgi:hypothetical protein